MHSTRRRLFAIVGSLFLFGTNSAAAETQLLTFVAGPSGVTKDPTIPVGPLGNVYTLHSADLQKNGRRDLILGMGIDTQNVTGPALIHIVRPTVDGTALIEVTRQLLGQGSLPATYGASQIVEGDFNRDDKPDIFIAAGGIDKPPLGGERNVLLVSNADGTLSDRSSTLPTAPDSTSRVTIGDINRDGIADLYVNNTPLPTRSYFLIGKGDGTFDQATDRLPSDVSAANESTFDSALLVDLDEDGYPDLVLGSFGDGPGRSIILYNDGTGNFANRPRINLPFGVFGPTASTFGVIAMDIDGDGKSDLIVLSTQSGSLQDVGAAVQVLINQGNGVFVDESVARLGSSASRTNGLTWTHLRTADINGDGRLDFYATGHQKLDSNGQVSLTVPIIWLNNGNGTFTAVDSGIFPNVSLPLEVMDVDGDGRLDFATVSVDSLGQIGYRAFLNRTPRTVPSEPIIGTAVAGDARAWISFTAPLGSGTSPIISHTATCILGTLAGVVTGTGAASPIALTGLTNGQLYSCTVTATSAAGNSLPSSPVSVRPAGSIALQASDRYLWLVPPAANSQRQGFLRVMNRENRSGQVFVWGLDAAGRRSTGTVTLTLAANESRQFNSSDLELGNPSKGLSGNIGQGLGDWTVVVRSDLDLEALAYIRTPDGFLTSMHDRVVGDGVGWFIPMVNPADNPNQVSHLRVINTNLAPVSLLMLGVDDAGASGATALAMALPALQSVDLTPTDLEVGNPSKGLSGSLGNGTGKWHVSLSATGRVSVQSLLADPLGKLTNLSTLPDLREPAPGENVLWLVPPASNTQQQGFVRLINRENRSSTVALWGIDDAGQRSPGTITLTLAARESRQLNSQDLEFGNAAKGLTGQLGDGLGIWRLHVLTDLDLLPMALIRTPDGFLTTIHDIAAADGLTVRVPIFNPADNPNQVSLLRVVNPNAMAVSVTVRGLDDLGSPGPGGTISLGLAAGSALELSATDLESGNVAKGLTGSLGNGSGKWALTVTATAAVKVLSLLRDPMGYLTDLSTGTKGSSGKLDP